MNPRPFWITRLPLALVATAPLCAQGGTQPVRLPPVVPDLQQAQPQPQAPYMGYAGTSTWTGIGGASPYQRAPLIGGFQGLGSGYTGYLPGFPVYSTQAGGFGAYPTGSEGGQAGGVRGPLPRLGPPPGESWPSWLEVAAEKRGLPPISPLRAVLVQGTDRVWFRERDEAVYVPLAFYDRFRIFEPSASVLVRDQGEFVLLMHDAGQLRSLGPCELEVVELTPDLAEMVATRITRAWVVARARKMRVRLPDGSELDALDGSYRIVERDGLIGIENRGRTPLQWRGHGMELELPPVHAMRLIAAAPQRERVPAPLLTTGAVELRREGRTLVVRGGVGGGSVVWSGVRVRLDEGNEAEFDPLAGTTFPDGSRPPGAGGESKQHP